jgi:hypothetical protein
MTITEENTNLDYILCDLLEVCMDELDELPLADLNELRDAIRETNEL